MNWRLIVPILAIVMCGCMAKVEQTAAPSKPAMNLNDPCRFLTPLEAGQILGQPVASTTRPSPTYCRYAAATSTAEPSALSVTFGIDNDVASYNALVQRDDAAAIAGLGDRAVWNTTDNSVVVVKGTRRLMLTIADAKQPSTLAEADLQSRAVAAAQKIVERM